MNILITGGEGFVASSLFEFLKHNHNVTSISRKDFDLTNSLEVNAFFENKYFDVVFHCAVVGGSRLKQDSYLEMDNNLKMYYNLHQLRNKHFKKFITFGSGAELYSTHTPYGFSKQVIAKSISETDNFYNLIIFALFDKTEWETRFIKANIKRYINKVPLVIHQNKYMDFFHMDDFLKIIDFYVNNENCAKSINFSYEKKYSLYDVASIINSLSDYKVDIVIDNKEESSNYCGDYNLNFTNINLYGLLKGIEKTYQDLLESNQL
jgi:nucleoside-diphosphate-sugar epimerase